MAPCPVLPCGWFACWRRSGRHGLVHRFVALLAPAWADGEAGYDDVSVAMALIVATLLLTICTLAGTKFRTRRHDVFEASHRFGTRAVMGCAWVNAMLLAQL